MKFIEAKEAKYLDIKKSWCRNISLLFCIIRPACSRLCGFSFFTLGKQPSVVIKDFFGMIGKHSHELHYTAPEPIGQDSNYGNDKKCFHKISSFVLEKDIKQLKIPERSIKPKPIKNGAAQTHKNTSFIFFNFKD